MSGSGIRQQEFESGATPFRLGDELRGERATLGKSLLDVQRDLKIKAAFIAAIEECDLAAFLNPGVVPGLVRSYARYLQRDPDEVLRRFCEETGFVAPNAARQPSPARPRREAAPVQSGLRLDFPLAQKPRRRLPPIPLAGIGSALVLLSLIGVLGYGGWTLLQNIQRVQFAPVEEAPIALAEVEPPVAPEPVSGPVLPDFSEPVAATALADLYRQQELEVPILVPRDGPIAALDPDRIGLLARRSARPETAVVASVVDIPVPGLSGAALGEEAQPNEPQVTAEDARTGMVVIAERPAWIRVYYPGGTVIFERILESGESYTVPDTEEVPMIWAGNSGSVYVRIGETLLGPIGRGTRAARDVPLNPAQLTERYAVVADIPGVIADALDAPPQAVEVLVQ